MTNQHSTLMQALKVKPSSEKRSGRFVSSREDRSAAKASQAGCSAAGCQTGTCSGFFWLG
jgi:hypothetical protein